LAGGLLEQIIYSFSRCSDENATKDRGLGSAFDRLLGYGLKYSSDFRDTHLGRIGASQPNLAAPKGQKHLFQVVEQQ
jgi:hypothetical protein